MTLAADKLQRIQGQINEAEEEIKKLHGEVELIDGRLTSELSLVEYDKAKITTLESEREELIRAQKRLSARVQALQSTVSETEKDVARAELKSAVKAHAKSIDQANEALENYKGEGLELIRSFVGIYRSMIDKRLAAEALRDKAVYFSELLEQPRPKLKTANSLSHEEDVQLADAIHNCIPMRPDPYRTSKYSGKLKELNDKRREIERAAVIAEKSKGKGNW